MSFYHHNNTGTFSSLLLTLMALCLVMGINTSEPAAQDLRFAQSDHVQIGGGIGLYPLGGSYSSRGQHLSLQGVQIEFLRLGISQLVSQSFRMELALNMGISLLTQEFTVDDPITDVTGITDLGVPFNWGFVVGGYYRFQQGITLGLGLGIDFFNTKVDPVDTSLFRVLCALGWERIGPLHDWYLHVRWINGITLLHGFKEYNWTPHTNFSLTGIEVVYGI
jgi:hypothetical protein